MSTLESGGKLPVVPESAIFRVQKELSPGSNNTAKDESFDPKERKLTFLEEQFIREYMKTFDFVRSYKRVGLTRPNAMAWLKDPAIRHRMDQIQLARSQEQELDQKEIIKFLSNVVKADISDVVEHIQGACRYCWGHDPKDRNRITHQYQFKSKAERIRAREAFAEKHKSKPKAKWPKFSNGGLGYSWSRLPHPDCPICEGQGQSKVIFKDTNAAGPARYLVSSVCINSAGKVELKFHDKMKAVELSMRHLGMLNKDIPDTNVTVQIRGGIAEQVKALTEDPQALHEQLEDQIKAEKAQEDAEFGG